jgi:KTSC domain
MAKKPFTLISSALRGGTYDPDTQELELSFLSGRTYSLRNVAPSVVRELQDADSPGNFFRDRMKGRY